jgi:hypothetical protein
MRRNERMTLFKKLRLACDTYELKMLASEPDAVRERVHAHAYEYLVQDPGWPEDLTLKEICALFQVAAEMLGSKKVKPATRAGFVVPIVSDSGVLEILSPAFASPPEVSAPKPMSVKPEQMSIDLPAPEGEMARQILKAVGKKNFYTLEQICSRIGTEDTQAVNTLLTDLCFDEPHVLKRVEFGKVSKWKSNNPARKNLSKAYPNKDHAEYIVGALRFLGRKATLDDIQKTLIELFPEVYAERRSFSPLLSGLFNSGAFGSRVSRTEPEGKNRQHALLYSLNEEVVDSVTEPVKDLSKNILDILSTRNFTDVPDIKKKVQSKFYHPNLSTTDVSKELRKLFDAKRAIPSGKATWKKIPEKKKTKLLAKVWGPRVVTMLSGYADSKRPLSKTDISQGLYTLHSAELEDCGTEAEAIAHLDTMVGSYLADLYYDAKVQRIPDTINKKKYLYWI